MVGYKHLNFTFFVFKKYTHPYMTPICPPHDVNSRMWELAVAPPLVHAFGTYLASSRDPTSWGAAMGSMARAGRRGRSAVSPLGAVQTAAGFIDCGKQIVRNSLDAFSTLPTTSLNTPNPSPHSPNHVQPSPTPPRTVPRVERTLSRCVKAVQKRWGTSKGF